MPTSNETDMLALELAVEYQLLEGRLSHVSIDIRKLVLTSLESCCNRLVGAQDFREALASLPRL